MVEGIAAVTVELMRCLMRCVEPVTSPRKLHCGGVRERTPYANYRLTGCAAWITRRRKNFAHRAGYWHQFFVGD